MSTIYPKAKTVVVWLGIEDYASEGAMEEFDDIESQYTAGKNKSNWKTEKQYWGDKTYSQKWVKSFKALFTRIYWTRMWIVQEVLLAN
jgi:hypothetical protein